MALMPAISYQTVMGFNWPELKGWHETAVAAYKALHGIE
jgi:hypothetical protein